MNQCPLPVDWLDFLEGRPSAATRAHLEVCTSCRILVHELQSQAVEAGPASNRLRAGVHHVARAMNLTGGAAPAETQPGQIWWTESSAETPDRLPVIVLRIFDEAGRSWVDVAPLWFDEDAATSADLLLSAEDSTTGVCWRVAFRSQTVVPSNRLDEALGVLTPSGHALLEQALAGTIAPNRRGTDLESVYDPRLTGDAWLEVPALVMAREYAALFNEEDALALDASQEQGSRQELAQQSGWTRPTLVSGTTECSFGRSRLSQTSISAPTDQIS